MPRPSPRFTRAIVIVLDGVGVGELPDAAAYGDSGSNTLGNLARRVRLNLPTLVGLGLPCLVPLEGLARPSQPRGCYGRMAEASAGKDSVTGHWELMGLVLDRAFPVFPGGFPRELMAEFERRIGRPTLGNVAASGTEILAALGEEHVRTGSPIVYTSADSVFQIAAHEQVVPLAELYRFCEIAYELVVTGLGMGRVIARPFVGEAGGFARTANRRDLAMPAPADTLLDKLARAGHTVLAVGKIDDLFAGRGITRAVHTRNDDHGMDVVCRALDEVPAGLIFANLVDCDTVYGHRNDADGYALNLERFDNRLAQALSKLRSRDLLLVTADHGNDPTTPGTDHSREYVPLLVAGPGVRTGADLGSRRTFADVGQTLAEAFGLPALGHGTSFLDDIVR